MRNIAMAVVIALAIGSPIHAQPLTTSEKLVQSGASGWAYDSGPNGHYNLNVWQTSTRGADGTPQAYVYFSAGRQLGPDSWESVSGAGYVPDSAMKATGTGIRLELADLTTVPGYYLTVLHCDGFTCQETGYDGAFPVDVVFTRVAGFSEERTGVTRRHSEFDWQYNASVDVVEVGTTTTTSAAVSGMLGMHRLPFENSHMGGGTMGSARGTTITIERTAQ